VRNIEAPGIHRDGEAQTTPSVSLVWTTEAAGMFLRHWLSSIIVDYR
jgi:hypothetical protein